MQKDRRSVTVMDIDFVNRTQYQFLVEDIFPALQHKEKKFIVTANPEIVMKAQEDDAFKKVIYEADYTVPDGIGIILAAKLLETPLEERIAGFDLALDLLNYADEHGLSCYFLGAKEEVNEKAVKRVQADYPNIHIAGRHNGYFDIGDRDLAEEIAATAPDIVLVAAGFPKQEKWIAAYKDLFDHGVFMGVGGTFDILAGEAKRAPEIWVKLNLEWFYRLLQQPKVRFKRTLKLFGFMRDIIKNKKRYK
ncbi:WecB/TagA/CpsF family glycosyltransferase [Oceanobacillus neutriphilus]|uniref:N-acetylglucosaminyldiphosphoundecaprenol N-acetyl-beta-D-mannosaminyltransferase n=1 Tax=Oceanobacillus neutriphilus TaxID=531815 RepID=A0ABQ2NR55_9BACI|nr:WecB/TagA/CpsF family glycosyltransferase [Oceanobacillus neutriphilus]GGP07941.1 acetylglucosaminyldiphosphoundecaprenol acetyl-beta-D-mannosaminyltransferase [Oceanobacillus neutriphilus]